MTTVGERLEDLQWSFHEMGFFARLAAEKLTNLMNLLMTPAQRRRYAKRLIREEISDRRLKGVQATQTR